MSSYEYTIPFSSGVAGASEFSRSITLRFDSIPKFNQNLHRFIQRSQAQTPHMLSILSIDPEPESLTLRVEIEDPGPCIRLRDLGYEALIPAFRSCLAALASLQNSKKVHGDVRPEYIHVSPCGRTRLVDRLADQLPSMQRQSLYIAGNSRVFLPPKLEFSLKSRLTEVVHSPYKTDLFALALVFVGEVWEEVRPEHYQTFEGFIEGLESKVAEIKEEGPSAFMRFLKESVLAPPENEALSPVDALLFFDNMKSLRELLNKDKQEINREVELDSEMFLTGKDGEDKELSVHGNTFVGKSVDYRAYFKSIGIAIEEDIQKGEEVHYLSTPQRLNTSTAQHLNPSTLLLPLPSFILPNQASSSTAQPAKPSPPVPETSAFMKKPEAEMEISLSEGILAFEEVNNSPKPASPFLNLLDDFIMITEPSLASHETPSHKNRNLGLSDSIVLLRQSTTPHPLETSTPVVLFTQPSLSKVPSLQCIDAIVENTPPLAKRTSHLELLKAVNLPLSVSKTTDKDTVPSAPKRMSRSPPLNAPILQSLSTSTSSPPSKTRKTRLSVSPAPQSHSPFSHRTSISNSIKQLTPRRLNNSTPQPFNASTDQQLNSSTPQQLNTSTAQQINSSTAQQINTSTPQQINSSTAQHLNTSIPQHLNTSTAQQLNISNRNPLNFSFPQPTSSEPLRTLLKENVDSNRNNTPSSKTSSSFKAIIFEDARFSFPQIAIHSSCFMKQKEQSSSQTNII